MNLDKFKKIEAVVMTKNVVVDDTAMKTVLLNLAFATYNRVENNRRQKFSPKTMISILELIDFMDKDPETRGAVIEDVKEIIDSLIQGYGTGLAPIRYWDGVDPIVYGISKKGWAIIEQMGVEIPANAKAWASEPDKAPNAAQQARNDATVSAMDRLNALRAKYDLTRATTEQQRMIDEAIEEAIEEAEEKEDYVMPEVDESDIDDESAEKLTSAASEEVSAETASGEPNQGIKSIFNKLLNQ